jgi:uncharacterized protein (DUF1800 family)
VTLTYQDAAHLLRRAGFGGLPSEIGNLMAYDLPAAVDYLLDFSAAPPVVAPADLYDTTKGQYNRWVSTLRWWLDRMRTSPCPLQEKLTLFWHGHFCSAQDKVDNIILMYNQNQTLRNLGLGSFRTLTHALAIDPAMLLYLDNYTNKVGLVQENFARELMELFTLGVNEYTQDDVVETARAWTGHGLDSAKTGYLFTLSRHDNYLKTIFGKNQNWDGPQTIDEILTGVKRPIAARYIAAKMWSFFAYPNPEPEVLDAIVPHFTAGDLGVRDLVKAIFLHPYFFSPKARQGLIRSPVEFVVAALRHTNLTAAATSPENFLDDMGQLPFYPPTVEGWKQNSVWISSASWWARASFARSVSNKAREAGLLAGARNLTVPAAIDAGFGQFGLGTPSPATRAALEAWLTAERAARGTAEVGNMMTLMLMSPDFNLA